MLFTLLDWFPRKHRFGAKTLMIWFSNLSAICVCFSTRCRGKSFQQERESTVVFFISYYSVQPDESSFAFSLNHTTCDLRERNLTRSVTTGIVDFSLHRLCRPYSKYSSIFFLKKYSVWQSVVRINYILKRFLMVIIKLKIIFANERQWKNWSFMPRGRG